MNRKSPSDTQLPPDQPLGQLGENVLSTAITPEIIIGNTERMTDVSTVVDEKGLEGEGEVVDVPQEEEVVFPDGGTRAWLCVLGGILGMFCGYGLAPSAGAFQTWYKNNYLSEYTQSQVAWIGGIQAFVTFGLSILTGSLFDLHGHRYLMACGTFLLTLGYCLLSLSTKYYQIFLCHSTLIPVGMNFMLIASLGVVGHWFSKRRGLAFGTISTGASIGAIVWPLIWANAPQRIGFGWSMRLIALICLLIGISAFFLLKTRLPPKPPGPFFHFQAFRSLPYCLFAFAGFTWVFGFFFFNVFIGTYGHLRGWDDIGPYFLIFVMVGSTLFRVPSGFIADRIGPYNITILSNIIMTYLLWLLLISKTIASTIIISVLFGMTSATFVSLQAPCVTRLCKDMRFAGTYVGMNMFFTALAQIVGPPAGGALLGSGSKEDQLARFPHAVILAGSMLSLSTGLVIAARLCQDKRLLAFV
ncbi:hypothetical protein I302_105143 [Kwoniella bestiolae CBS 10118]|uniref:Major facilitator superfamily (MFS) profile domain-containing protein n=1 Tax=Kwoniella bestiolae CBS 10118 TaxID=1296100 RepID=A0A1B9FSB4_9TREE|nr:hypothetical protein I302_08432 [Kwoniella bestiolae CBS 10118]OCF21655.1 hypothetical protein I302_08432 [Kwoniella bestiolae CBS 10118]